jgi:hypothetical protein
MGRTTKPIGQSIIFLESLVCAAGSSDRAINYPTDQAIFLWAFLSYRTYRIPSHVQSLVAAAKYCFRYVALQIAMIQARGDVDGPLIEAMAPALPTNGTESNENDSHVHVDKTSSCEDMEM